MKKVKRKQRKQEGKKSKASKYYVEVDTNVYQISLDCLNSKTEIATGDAEFCKSCQAVMNYQSVITVVGGKQIWNCEFCNTPNPVMVMDEEEKPKTEAISYLIEAAAQVENKKMQGQDISVIFCLDVSGSMCVT